MSGSGALRLAEQAAAALLLMTSAAPRAEVIGEENRSRLSAVNQDRFAGVGRLICIEPATGNRVFTTATLVGDRSTILGVGHFRRVAAGPHIRAIAASISTTRKAR